MKEKIALSVLIAALSGGVAFAAGQTGQEKQPGAETGAGVSGQQTGMQGGITFQDVDKNGDGEVSEDEWKEVYSDLDQGGDGKVDQADFAQFEGKGTQQEGLTPEGGMEGEGLTPEGTPEEGKQY